MDKRRVFLGVAVVAMAGVLSHPWMAVTQIMLGLALITLGIYGK